MRRSPNAKDVETVAAPTADLAPGENYSAPAFANGAVVAGKYLIEETLAQGGIGVVVVARHLALQQRVAIKYLRPNTLSNPAIVERFVREARLAAQISSEHVVRVHDVGSLPEAGPYMVMEYLVGEDLGRTIQNGPLGVDRAIDYVLQACDALAEAHALRIVHRDIKPENMFLAQRVSNTPILKIIDFGISKVAPGRGEGERWAAQTIGSERFGTPLYMSPEQLRSTSNVDARTDIWSLGVVLHELLTGALPFLGDGLPQICTSVLTAPPIPLTQAGADVPPQLEAVVLKCLEKEPAHRYRNVAELAQDLVPFGPPSAADRVQRISEVVRRGGDSIRPPTPAPDAPPGNRRRTATTDARAVTTVSVRLPSGSSHRTAVAAAAGLACAGLFVAVAHHMASSAAAARRAAPPPAVSNMPPPAAAPSASAPAPALDVPAGGGGPPAAAAGAATEAPSPATSSSPAASAAAAVPVRARSAARAHSTASPNAAPPAKAPPPAINSRREQFGERE